MDTEALTLQKRLSWSTTIGQTQRQILKPFASPVCNCARTVGGNRTPRPMGHAMHADKNNELFHFDFLYIGPSTTGEFYSLILKDDASSFIWLECCEAADADSTLEGLKRWFASFGMALTWVPIAEVTSKTK